MGDKWKPTSDETRKYRREAFKHIVKGGGNTFPSIEKWVTARRPSGAAKLGLGALKKRKKK